MPGVYFSSSFPTVEGFVPEYADSGDLIVFKIGSQVHLRQICAVLPVSEMSPLEYPLEASGYISGTRDISNTSGATVLADIVQYYRTNKWTVHILQMRR